MAQTNFFDDSDFDKYFTSFSVPENSKLNLSDKESLKDLLSYNLSDSYFDKWFKQKFKTADNEISFTLNDGTKKKEKDKEEEDEKEIEEEKVEKEKKGSKIVMRNPLYNSPIPITK